MYRLSVWKRTTSPGKQQGAALIVVLAVLVVTLMLGLSSMQSSLIDERLAGNYRAQVQAQMAAERAAAEALANVEASSTLSAFFNNASNNVVDCTEDFPSSSCLGGENLQEATALGGASGAGGKYGFFTLDGVGRYIYATGEVVAGSLSEEKVIASSYPIFLSLEPTYLPSLSNLSPLTVVSRIFNFKSGNSNNFGIARQGDGNVGTAIAVSDAGDVQTVMDGIPDNREANYATDGDGNIVTEQYFDVFSDPLLMQEFVSYIKDYPGASDELGVEGSPKVTYISGDYVMPKDVGVAAGLLVVDGNFTWNGNNDFKGLIIVLGQEFKYHGGGSGSIVGSVLHASVTEGENGEWGYGIAEADASEVDSDIDISGGGGSIIKHDVDVLNEVAAILPPKAMEMLPVDDASPLVELGFDVKSWE